MADSKRKAAKSTQRRKGRGKDRALDATPPPVPVVADAPVSLGFASLLRKMPPAPKRRNEVTGRSLLPPELLEALEDESGLYRPSRLRRVEGVTVEKGNLVSLLCQSAVDASWCGGTLMGFADSHLIFQGEVVHVDPASGRLYAAAPKAASLPADLATSVEHWCYQPFDFSAAILAAASAYVSQHPGLQESLAGVHGRLKARPVEARHAGVEPARLWAQPWGLLWGPPGTGKTETMATLLAEAVRRHPEQHILAVAPTNRAVDNLALRVAQKLAAQGALLLPEGGARLFRGGVGVGEALSREYPQVLHDATYQDLVARVAEVERQARWLEAQGADAASVAEVKAAAVRLRKTLPDETLYVVEKGHATLVLLTVHRALRLVSELEARSRFSRVVVDEAGMVTCAAAALILPLGRQVTLAGDPKQIGPICRVPEGARPEVHRWLRNSPLSHLVDANRVASEPHVLFLRTQHRMHPEISSVVSRFAYSGMLRDGEGPRTRVPARVPAYPDTRANWVVLDETVREGTRTAAERGARGRGYQRKASVEVAVNLATEAIRARLKVLAITPYRAQAELLRQEGTRAGFEVEHYTASTIHKQQGAEFDVVLVDTVAAGRPFLPAELTTLLNVAASRAREYLFVISSRAEAEAAIPSQFLGYFTRVAMPARRGARLRPVTSRDKGGLKSQVIVPPDCLGAEISAMRGVRPLFTQEQVGLFERRFGEGHHLVRGVAGSGKTYVLAHWVSRVLEERPEARVLVSFFNKALGPLMTKLLREALLRRLGTSADDALRRIDIQHVWVTPRQGEGLYDAVFVDEAQDMDPEKLERLYRLAKPATSADGRGLRAFLLFMDDSQNVYGHQPIEEMKELLPKELQFTGRTRVLREAFRSTRQVLDLAFNVVLDPHRRHPGSNPGMREFMRVQELMDMERLEDPDTSLDGLHHVTYTEREGVVPTVRGFETTEKERRWLVDEVKRLIHREHVKPSDILVVSLTKPSAWAHTLVEAGVPAVAFGGSGGQDSAGFPVESVDFVRATTVHSCKGHESPVVFFCDVDGLDDLSWMRDIDGKSPREVERMRRALFYVGSTRAMVRQYLSGTSTGRFVQVARFYASLMASHPADLLDARREAS